MPNPIVNRRVVISSSAGASLLSSVTAYNGVNSNTTSAIDTTGAELITISCVFYTLATIPVIIDSEGNTWTALTKANSVTAAAVIIYYCINPTTSANHTFTATSINSYPAIVVNAFSCASSPTFESQNSNNALGGSSITTGSVTPTTGSNLVLTVANCWTADILSIDNGFTISGTVPPTINTLAGASAYKLDQSGAVNPTWTWTGSNGETAATIAVFKI